MIRLLKAEFVRLFKDKVFLFVMLLSFGLSACTVFIRWQDGQKSDWYVASYTDVIFAGALYITIAMAAFVGLFVGTEFSEGTIRNKLILGHKRGHVYLTEFVVCSFANMLMISVNVGTAVLLGTILIGESGIGTGQLIANFSVILAATVALTAILLLVVILICNKAICSVVCLILTLVLFLGSSKLYVGITEPEYYIPDSYMISDYDTGETAEVGEQEKNPFYVSGIKRVIYETLHTVLPSSQLYRMSAFEKDGLLLMVLSDIAVVFLITAAGVFVFKKKDLK